MTYGSIESVMLNRDHVMHTCRGMMSCACPQDKEHKGERGDRGDRGGGAHNGGERNGSSADQGAQDLRAQLNERRQQMSEPLPPSEGRVSRRNSSASRR